MTFGKCKNRIRKSLYNLYIYIYIICSVFFLKVGGLCLSRDSRKIGGRGALIVWAWKCQTWPMKVSKDHILKQNENAYCKCSGRRMKCKRGEAWNKLEESGMASPQAWHAQIEKSFRPWTPTPLKAWSNSSNRDATIQASSPTFPSALSFLTPTRSRSNWELRCTMQQQTTCPQCPCWKCAPFGLPCMALFQNLVCKLFAKTCEKKRFCEGARENLKQIFMCLYR